ncbi:uncharacterized protein LOC135931444 isoform X2 [Gordionus sp. m RMFG-2023]|uniref:uncharacterized protein LOC135931444 isoform X2 n=1 Tax=Gordionus sp. m RMFG-2023 TaxID=3053472 RepID=UPI0031FC4799
MLLALVKSCIIICLIYCWNIIIVASSNSIVFNSYKNYDITFCLIYTNWEYNSKLQLKNLKKLKLLHNYKIHFSTLKYSSEYDYNKIFKELENIPSYYLFYGNYPTIHYQGSQNIKYLNQYLHNILYEPFIHIRNINDIQILNSYYQYTLIYHSPSFKETYFDDFLHEILKYKSKGEALNTIGFGLSTNFKLQNKIYPGYINKTFFIFFDSYKKQELLIETNKPFDVLKWLQNHAEKKIEFLTEKDISNYNSYNKGDETSLLLLVNFSNTFFDNTINLMHTIYDIYLYAISDFDVTNNYSFKHSFYTLGPNNPLERFNESLSYCLAIRHPFASANFQCKNLHHDYLRSFATVKNEEKRCPNLETLYHALRNNSHEYIEPPYYYESSFYSPHTLLIYYPKILHKLYIESIRESLSNREFSWKRNSPLETRALQFCQKLFNDYRTASSEIYIVSKTITHLESIVAQIRKSFKNIKHTKLHFKILDTSLLDGAHSFFLGVDDFNSLIKDNPSVLIIDEKVRTKYLLEHQDFNPNNLVKFILDYANGLLPRFMISEILPAPPISMQNNIVELNSVNFESIIYQASKNVIVMFYTHYCGYCLSVTNIFMLIAHQSRENKNTLFSSKNQTVTYPISSPWNDRELRNFIKISIRNNNLNIVGAVLKNYHDKTLKQRFYDIPNSTHFIDISTNAKNSLVNQGHMIKISFLIKKQILANLL